MEVHEIVRALWRRIKKLLPPKRSPGPKGGRPPVDDRIVLEGIVFVLQSGIPWRLFPRQFGCSRSTCWRRIAEWQQRGTWNALHALLLAELRRRGKLRWRHAVVDSSSVRALEGGEKTGPNPTDRGRGGSKHHLLVDGRGVPLAARLTGAHRHDVTQLVPLLQAIPPVRGKPGQPRRYPCALYGDRAYDSQAVRTMLAGRRVRPYLARRNTSHGSGLGKYRWVVERSVAWIHGFRRLRLRWERRADIHQAFLTLAVCILCLRCIWNRF
ncbi:MAG: IS5 family transposase [Thermoguttaceae bacterium]|nr:IS5 family transposase [Thermoguttaceae bacterium]